MNSFLRCCFRILMVAYFLMVICQGTAYAVQPDEMLSDPVLEQRARALGKDLRCLVCQNQSIDDSDADLARDLRILLRQRLKAGDSDAQAKQYLVARYGDYVLLDPPFKITTLVLWFGPGLLLLAAIMLAISFCRRRNILVATLAPLSEEEQQRLTVLLPEFQTEEAKKL